jgi:hypothetical protein
MNTFIILIIIIMFFYTAGFSVQLWKDKNKLGSVTVFIMALTIAIAPFFTILL